MRTKLTWKGQQASHLITLTDPPQETVSGLTGESQIQIVGKDPETLSEVIAWLPAAVPFGDRLRSGHTYVIAREKRGQTYVWTAETMPTQAPPPSAAPAKAGAPPPTKPNQAVDDACPFDDASRADLDPAAAVYMRSIDVLMTARAYAQSEYGIDLPLSLGDVRALAATLMIGAHR